MATRPAFNVVYGTVTEFLQDGDTAWAAQGWRVERDTPLDADEAEVLENAAAEGYVKYTMRSTVNNPLVVAAMGFLEHLGDDVTVTWEREPLTDIVLLYR